MTTMPEAGRLPVAPEVELHLESCGDGEPPLVLVHGFTGSARDWEGVTGPLASRRRVVAYEHRGHGRSSRCPDRRDYTFDRLVEDLSAVVASLGGGPVDLLGHSMGGVVALRFALARPEAVRSLVLMDAAPGPSDLFDAGRLDALAAVGRSDGMEVANRLVREAGRQAADAADERRAAQGRPPGFRPPATTEREARVAWSFSHLDPEALVAFGHELASFPPLTERLGALSCPVTVVVGEHDRPLRPGAALLAERIPGARSVVIPEAAHSPQEDRPEAWLAAVESHLAGP